MVVVTLVYLFSVGLGLFLLKSFAENVYLLAGWARCEKITTKGASDAK